MNKCVCILYVSVLVHIPEIFFLIFSVFFPEWWTGSFRETTRTLLMYPFTGTIVLAYHQTAPVCDVYLNIIRENLYVILILIYQREAV